MPFILIIIAGLSATGIASLCTPLARRIALQLGAVDAPGGRRVHARVTPRLGGIAVIAGYVVALVMTWLVAGPRFPMTSHGSTAFFSVIGGGVLLGLVGAIDDVKELGAKKKLLGQIIAAAVAWVGGARIYQFHLPGLGTLRFGLFLSFCITVFWVIAFINAVNLIDGLDGLASGVVFFAALTNTIVAFATGNAYAAVVNGALGGAVLGFLFYNFNPATIFLGDTGSMFLGYVLGTAALLSGRQKESTLVSLLVPVLALGLPISDTIFSMIRRFLEKRPIFSPDRGHIHHRLLDLGLTHRRSVLLLYGASAVLCALATAVAFGNSWQVGAALIGAVVTVLGITRFASYFQGVLQRAYGEKDIHAEAVDALRGALPRFITQVEGAQNAMLVWAALEELLASGQFAHGDVKAKGEESPLWRWSPSAADIARQGKLVIVEFPLRLFPGTEPATLRVGCLTRGTFVSPQVKVLLQVMADVAESSLRKAHANAPQQLMRVVDGPGSKS